MCKLKTLEQIQDYINESQQEALKSIKVGYQNGIFTAECEEIPLSVESESKLETYDKCCEAVNAHFAELLEELEQGMIQAPITSSLTTV